MFDSSPDVMSADDIFKPGDVEERRSGVLNVRIPRSLKTRLEEFAKFQSEKAKLTKRDAAKVTVGDVVVRLLTNGLERAWAQAGLPPTPTKAEVDALIQSMKSPS